MLFRKTPAAFVARAALLLGALGLASLTPPFETLVLAPLRELNADLTEGTLRALGIATDRRGLFIYGPTGFGIEVIDECTGATLALILIALTLAFPASWKARLACLGLGSALIFVMNFLRLVSLFLIGIHWPELFHGLHVFVWQGTFIILVFVYWYVWASRTGGGGGAASPAAADRPQAAR